MSDCCLTSAISWQVIFECEDDDVCFVLDQHGSSSMKQQSVGRHFAPLRHIILIPTKYQSYSLDFTWLGLEPRIHSISGISSLKLMTFFNYQVIGCNQDIARDWFMVFNATFNNISVLSWTSVLFGGGNHQPVASHWKNLSHNVASSTPHHERDSNSQL